MNETTLTQDGNVLTLKRAINASKDKIWQAYTDPEVFSRWWGPDGWMTIIKHFDFSEGGYALYGMKCEDKNQTDWYGKVSWGKFVYQSISPKEGFAYTDYFSDEEGNTNETMPSPSIDMQFEEIDGKTLITSVATYGSEEALRQVLEMGMEAGIKQTLDRLEALLS